MSNSSGSNKVLAPIYAALDNKQYQRAIKLCLQQPADNAYVQALLAHCYSKSDQRTKAIQVLGKLLLNENIAGSGGDNQSPGDYFHELRLAQKYAQPGDAAAAATASLPVTTAVVEPTPSPARNSKSGKKGKKKPTKAVAVSSTAPASVTASADTAHWDWIDALDEAPTLEDDNFDQIPPWPVPADLADPTLISTLQHTLARIKLSLTAYQLNAWWAAVITSSSPAADGTTYTSEAVADHLRETFHLGICVYMSPQYQYLNLRDKLLPQLQVTALQLARLGKDSATPTLWAAQAALWQLVTSDKDTSVMVPPQKLALLPRLAASMAEKVVNDRLNDSSSDSTSRLTVEGFVLWLQALEGQWETYKDAVQKMLDLSDSVMGLTRAMLLEYKVNAWHQMGNLEQARMTAAECLREENPDQWDIWIKHLELDDTDNYEATITLANELKLDDRSAYPRRGPPLIVLEALRRRIETATQKGPLIEELLSQIQSYGDTFGSRTACTFSDLKDSINCLHSYASTENVAVLLPWLSRLLQSPSAKASASERRGLLRGYIFALKTMLTLLRYFPDLQSKWLPDWKELVCTWKDFQSNEEEAIAAQTEEERKNAQKESRPADEMLLLAIQILLVQMPNSEGRIMAASLLQTAIEQSPYNAYLKLALIRLCADLNAADRAWDLFRDIFIKHIQYESCAYLILPHLCAGGMYQEVIRVCQDIMRLQTHALHEAMDYTPHALDNGTVSKADEFIRFQRQRLNKSLTALHAKGLMMNCAPLLQEDDQHVKIGAFHGVVGGEEDLERVHLMITEAHYPLGTFSLLRLKGSVKENSSKFSDNRDLNALAYQVFEFQEFPTQEDIIRDCIRRAHHHNLLLRATLCVDATKGPKKGKVVKPSEALTKRCKSLLAEAQQAESFIEMELSSTQGYGPILHSMIALCRAIAVSSGGCVTRIASVEDDSLVFREDKTAEFLQAATNHLQDGRTYFQYWNSVSLSPGLAITDAILPLLALLRMCATVNDIYGWTKKRRNIRKCAGCLYEFVQAFRAILDDMELSLKELEEENMESLQLSTEIKDKIVPSVLSDDAIGEVTFVIQGARGATKLRIEAILEDVRSSLESFDTEE
jgi:hypothetical protein